MNLPVKCAIIDDNPGYRNRLARLIEMIPETCVVYDDSLVGPFIESINKVSPELLYISAPLFINHEKSLTHLIFSQPHFRIVLMAESAEHSLQAIKSGVFDYLVHPVDIDEVGNSVSRYKAKVNRNPGIEAGFIHKLTSREKELLPYIFEGLTSKQIAGILKISRHTVDTHRRNILKKAGPYPFSALRVLFGHLDLSYLHDKNP